MKQAKAWLENCRQHHEQCNRRLPSAFVPSRLVHVRQLENGSVTSARLVTDTSLPSGTPYLSLSHCWGGARFLTLTHANLHQFQTAIPVAELTAVFHDALYVAFQLGIPYVWIGEQHSPWLIYILTAFQTRYASSRTAPLIGNTSHNEWVRSIKEPFVICQHQRSRLVHEASPQSEAVICRVFCLSRLTRKMGRSALLQLVLKMRNFTCWKHLYCMGTLGKRYAVVHYLKGRGFCRSKFW